MKHKNWIRFVCIALAAVMLAGGATGCAGAGESTSQEVWVNASSKEGTATDGTSKEGASQEGSSKEASNEATSGGTQNANFPDRANATTGEGQVKVLKEGDVAPDFTATLVDGSTFTLSEHDGEVVLLNFFATWCGPCMREMPAFEKLQNDGLEGVAILCVDCMEEKKTVDTYVNKEKFSFAIAYDKDGVIGKYYPTDGIPYTLVINKGVIAKIYLGARDAETQYKEYKGAIDACLAE